MKITNAAILVVIALLIAIPFSIAGTVEYATFKLDPVGKDDYNLVFMNQNNFVYSVPYITNYNNVFKYGSNIRDLVFTDGVIGVSPVDEFSYILTPNVGHLDYFIIGPNFKDVGVDNVVTRVLRYNHYDKTDQLIIFEDMATGTTFSVPLSPAPFGEANRKGDIILDGYKYRFYVVETINANPPLIMDLNADGKYKGAENRVVVKGGGIIDLGFHEKSYGGHINVQSDGSLSWFGEGGFLVGIFVVPFKLFTIEPEIREETSINIQKAANETLNLNIFSLKSTGSIFLERIAVGTFQGVTDYGAIYTIVKDINGIKTLHVEYPVK